jgi:5-methylcytosine-specific restriction endonuclease McrA
VTKKQRYNKAWYEVNSERKKKANRAWKNANPEKCRAYSKAWWEANPERHIASVVAWQKANPEKCRVSRKARYEANREKEKARAKAWREANPERRSALHANRKAHRHGVAGTITVEQLLTLYTKYGHCCLCCHKKKRLTPDHVIPFSKGGSNHIGNIQPLCSSCNSRKFNNTTDYRRLKCQQQP